MKKVWIVVLVLVAVLAVLLVPVKETLGGVSEYRALSYRLVCWEDGTRSLYGPWDRGTSLAELRQEAGKLERFTATVLELTDTVALVEPVGDTPQCDKISFSVARLPDIGVKVGSEVELAYDGLMRETYPASIDVLEWRLAKDMRHRPYEGIWLDRATAKVYDTQIFTDIVITEIYADCFFARCVIPMPYTIKLNGVLSEDWCVGDQVITTYEEAYYDEDTGRVEVDFLSVAPSDFELDSDVCYKPVICLYPEERTEVEVTLAPTGGLTCTYPKYDGGWHVTADPDGTLTDEAGQTYNYLYWEGLTYARYDMSRGFCVRGEDTAAFLEDALARLGLTRKEANEFIVYWLPLMEPNAYNVISFQQEAYTAQAPLEISPTPDTLIRVFMTWQGSEEFVAVAPQDLTAPERQGFTAVEWGGTELVGG